MVKIKVSLRCNELWLRMLIRGGGGWGGVGVGALVITFQYSLATIHDLRVFVLFDVNNLCETVLGHIRSRCWELSVKVMSRDHSEMVLSAIE